MNLCESTGNYLNVCYVHSFDDPIATWHGIAESFGFMQPGNLVKTESGNQVLFLTAKGGHVGWPVGWYVSFELGMDERSRSQFCRGYRDSDEK